MDVFAGLIRSCTDRAFGLILLFLRCRAEVPFEGFQQFGLGAIDVLESLVHVCIDGFGWDLGHKEPGFDQENNAGGLLNGKQDKTVEPYSRDLGYERQAKVRYRYLTTLKP